MGGEDEWTKVAKGERGLVFTCGSGMSASVGWLAHEVIREAEGGMVESAIYDEVSLGSGQPKCEKEWRLTGFENRAGQAMRVGRRVGSSRETRLSNESFAAVFGGNVGTRQWRRRQDVLDYL